MVLKIAKYFLVFAMKNPNKNMIFTASIFINHTSRFSVIHCTGSPSFSSLLSMVENKRKKVTSSLLVSTHPVQVENYVYAVQRFAGFMHNWQGGLD